MNHLLSVITAAATMAFALPVFAISPDVRVTNVVFSHDFETATVTLSQALPYATVRFDMYRDGEIRRNGAVAANNTTVLNMGGLRDDFLMEGGEGSYRVAFQVCQHGADRLHVDKDCSERYFLTVDFKENTPFPDVPASHPNAEAIAYVKAEGIVEGYPDGTFRPDQTINRAEFVKILMGGSKSKEERDECLTAHANALWGSVFFSDVDSSFWFGGYICVAKEQQLINGYPDGLFRPDNHINFVEAAKILSVYYNTLNTFCSGPEPLAGKDGCATGDDHPWYEWFVRSLQQRNVIPLSIEKLDQYITRGEMAELIYRLREKPLPVSRRYEDFERSSITVENCGDIMHFATATWYEDFVQESTSANIPMSGYSEGCVSNDGKIFYVIWDGGFCAKSRVLEYTIASENLRSASIMHNMPPGCYNVRSFGKQTGHTVQLTGYFENEDCKAVYYYDYNLVNHAAVITKTDWKCR